MTALISPEELRDRLDGPVLVDVQYNLGGPPGRDDYLLAHLPGAHHVDLDAELSGPPGPEGRHPMPTAHSVESALRRCGVDNDTPVVVYDRGPVLAAARAWWVFRYFGLRDVRVLDGGLSAWRETGCDVTTDLTEPRAGTFTATPGGMPLLDADEAAQVAQTGILLDARAAERFSGESEPIDRIAGHIPGAVNAPMSGNLQEGGRYRTRDELREHYAGLGVRPGAAVGAYCGSGVTAAHTALALHEIGVEAPVYVGSWSHWITDAGRPVARS
jgi:thiosulfate/3-mercaptopyruvate sulfurtransferase